MEREKQARSRCFCITINNPEKLEEGMLTALKEELKKKAKYFVFGQEVGEQGTPHLQGFVWFKNQLVFPTVKKIFLGTGAHIEQAKGTAYQATVYCKKDGKFEEWGVPPTSPSEKGELGAATQQEKWEHIRDLAKSGDIDTCLEKYPKESIGSYRTLKQLKNDFRTVPAPLETLDNWWFYGKPGSGKTRRAYRLYPGLYDHLIGKWWDDYDGEDIVLYGDMGIWHKELGTELKRAGGNAPFRVEVKGASMLIRPRRIIVTSNYRIDEVWDAQDQTTRDAIHRRFQEVEILLEDEQVIWEAEAREKEREKEEEEEEVEMNDDEL